jgi:hypothetical protein
MAEEVGWWARVRLDCVRACDGAAVATQGYVGVVVDHPARGQAVGGVVVATGASLGLGVCDGASVATRDCRGGRLPGCGSQVVHGRPVMQPVEAWGVGVRWCGVLSGRSCGLLA